MFKRSLYIILSLSILCFTGCSSVENLTFEELMEEVNAKHQEVEAMDVDISDYIGDLVDDEQRNQYYLNNTQETYDPKKMLTQQQAMEDVTYLFDAFHDCYGPYEYFGGAKVFDEAEEKIKGELQKQESIKSEDFEKILLKQLRFVKDGHFKINMKFPNPTKFPFFFRETAFQKTERGYQTTDGKQVKSMEGYENLDEVMKRSLSKEGELVYYPVLLKDCDFWDALGTPQTCDETLTIHYTNGETEKLEAEPYQIYTEMSIENPEKNKIVRVWEDGEIPVFQFNMFDEKHRDSILTGAKKLREAPVSILDLRSNTGGNGGIPEEWMERYTQKSVSGHKTVIDTKEGRETEYSDTEETWVENDKMLIILVGKYSASASEWLLDLAYNVENVLIVGENTLGGIIGMTSKISLPNSACQVDIGSGKVSLFPEDEGYMEEFRGVYPDIWVPAKEAEDLILQFLEHYGVTES